MKAKTQFVCNQCGHVYAKWQGRCDECGAWNSLVEEMIRESKVKMGGGGAIFPLTEAETAELVLSAEKSLQLNASFRRFSTMIGELDRCFGESEGEKGMVQGSVVLLGGEPGIGKSTLLTQVVLNFGWKLQNEAKKKKVSKGEKKVDNLGKNERNTGKNEGDEGNFSSGVGRLMYVCGEESPQQINLRMKRLLKKSEQLADLPLDYVMTTDVDVIVELIKSKQPALLIVDSVQTLRTNDLAGQAGSLGQIKESAERITKIAKVSGIPTFLVGHVTKEGGIAGPKVLEHMVDAIFELSGERSGELRFLRTLKNRFGATDEIGVFQMTELGMQEVANPSEYFLQGTQRKTPGSGVVCVLEGTRPLLTEVQALVLPSQLAMPRRVGRGIELARIQVLAAVLQKHCGLPLGISDVFLSVVGGMSVKEAGIDLGLAAAMVSSMAEKPLPEKSVFIGEVGLMGEVRPVMAFERRAKEAKRLGYESIYSWQTHKNVKELLRDLKLLQKLR